MNSLQQEVLETIYTLCLKEKPNVSLVEGPPGTGKSRLIVNLILQLVYGSEVRKRLRILMCASSNAAVDIIALKLLKARSKINSVGKLFYFCSEFGRENHILTYRKEEEIVYGSIWCHG